MSWYREDNRMMAQTKNGHHPFCFRADFERDDPRHLATECICDGKDWCLHGRDGQCTDCKNRLGWFDREAAMTDEERDQVKARLVAKSTAILAQRRERRVSGHKSYQTESEWARLRSEHVVHIKRVDDDFVDGEIEAGLEAIREFGP